MAFLEKHNNVNVWWFPQEFCQSRFGEYRSSGTNSCTLISLILADKISKESQFHVEAAIPLSRGITQIFGDAMNEGNNVYSKIFARNDINNVKQRRTTPNLSIPEAVTALEEQVNLNFNLHEWFYTHLTANPSKDTYATSVSTRIAQIFKLGVQLFQQLPRNSAAKNLFAALIADNRTTLFVFEFPRNLVYFFDSHQHGRRAGAVAAQCSLEYVDELTNWFVSMLYDIYNSKPSVYEISFLTTNADAPSIASI